MNRIRDLDAGPLTDEQRRNLQDTAEPYLRLQRWPQPAPQPGDRVRMTADMTDDPDPILEGATGVVVWCHGSVGQISVQWDPPFDHRSLLLLSTDPWEVIPDGS